MWACSQEDFQCLKIKIALLVVGTPIVLLTRWLFGWWD